MPIDAAGPDIGVPMHSAHRPEATPLPRRSERRTLAQVAIVVAVVSAGMAAIGTPRAFGAGTEAPQAPQRVPATTGVQVAQQTKSQRPPAAKATRTEPGASSGDGGLRQRVETLEEQLIDMQVVIGTLESLARSGGGGGSNGGARFTGASEAARIDALETQIRAMTVQIEQLSAQVRQQSGGRMEAPPVATQPPPGPRGEAPGFGSVTVSPGGRDPIGQMISSERGGAPERRELPPPAANAGSAKELYETAYGYLLQQDYGAAEAAFEEFLRRHPSDRLASDAQYWLGETLFVQRRYKPAGQAFLKVIQSHRTSAKAPNSLLMLAMTLEQLGQKDCALFTELDTRHPNAAADIKSRARIVRQRVGC